MRIKFYKTSSGRSPVEEFIESLSQKVQQNLIDMLTLLSDGHQLTMPMSKSLSSIHRGLHELRCKDQNNQIRIFYYFKKGDFIYIVHAIKKKTQIIPKNDRLLLLHRIKEV